MNIRVLYSAQVRQAAGMFAEDVEAPEGCTIDRLVGLIAERSGEPLRSALLAADGGPLKSNLVFVGEDMVRWGSSRPLADDDVVSIVSPISGG